MAAAATMHEPALRILLCSTAAVASKMAPPA
jgi:hypothetical protein